MAEGLQVFDAAGNKILDISDSLTKYLYVATVGPGNGSVTVSGLTGFRPWFTAYRLSSGTIDYLAPIFSISGTTVSWTYASGSPTGNQAPMRLFVGIY
jgi:hypothetical protein